MVERLKLTHFYTSPTAIRLLLKAGDSWVRKYDTSSLRILGCGMIVCVTFTHPSIHNSSIARIPRNHIQNTLS